MRRTLLVLVCIWSFGCLSHSTRPHAVPTISTSTECMALLDRTLESWLEEKKWREAAKKKLDAGLDASYEVGRHWKAIDDAEVVDVYWRFRCVETPKEKG